MTIHLGQSRWAVSFEDDKAAHRRIRQWDVDGGMYGHKMRRLWSLAARRNGVAAPIIEAALDAALAWTVVS